MDGSRMNQFLDWVDSEGGIYSAVMHGFTDAELDDLGIGMVQRQQIGRIKHHIEEAERLWQDLVSEND